MGCPKCWGAGFIHRPAKRAEAGAVFTASGPALLVPCQVCNGADKRLEYLRRLCRLNGDEATRRFDDYYTHVHGDKALRAARWLLANNGWLTLSGNVGTGKTFLLQALVNEAVAAGRMGIYLTMADLLEHLRRAYTPGVEVDSDALFDNIMRCEVLCIDEVDKYNPTPWAEEKLMQIVNARYRRWYECITVWAVNDIADVSGYLKSRMLDGRFIYIPLKHQDVRPETRR